MTDSTVAPLNIYQRLNAAKKQIAYIQKDKQVENYKAVTHDQVTAHTRGILMECGIAVIPTELSAASVLTGTASSKGTPLLRFEAKYRIEFVNIDNPSDRFPIEVTAHANDYGDKAPGKAVSYATKTALLKALQLETGEGDESRVQSESEGLSGDKLAEFKIAVDGAETPEQLKLVWKEIATACREAQDLNAYEHFKSLVKAKGEKK